MGTEEVGFMRVEVGGFEGWGGCGLFWGFILEMLDG